MDPAKAQRIPWESEFEGQHDLIYRTSTGIGKERLLVGGGGINETLCNTKTQEKEAVTPKRLNKTCL